MKIKAKNKHGRLLVLVKLSKNEELSERELEFLSKRTILGLLKPAKKRNRLMEYSGPAGLSLHDRLKKSISMRQFYLIMAQVCDMSRKIKGNNLFDKNLLLDPRYVFINESTNELQFIYLPIVSSFTGADYLGFMSSLAYTVKCDVNQDPEYITKFSFFLRSLEGFSADKIDAYISSVDRDAVNQVHNKNPRQSGFITNKQEEYYQHYSAGDYDEHTDLLNKHSLGVQEDLDQDTGLLVPDSGEDWCLDAGTDLLTQDSVQLENSVQPRQDSTMTLRRVLNDEIIYINKPVFRIGKEKSYVDYFVADNNAVSRSHADLIVRGGRCFVKDLNSKNRSYINGEALVSNMETEIFDGDTLKLANEEFIFKR